MQRLEIAGSPEGLDLKHEKLYPNLDIEMFFRIQLLDSSPIMNYSAHIMNTTLS